MTDDKARKGDGLAVYCRSSYTKQSPPAHVDTSHWRLGVVERVKRDGTIADFRFFGATRPIGGVGGSHERLLRIDQTVVNIEAMEALTHPDQHWPDPWPNGSDEDNLALGSLREHVSFFKHT